MWHDDGRQLRQRAPLGPTLTPSHAPPSPTPQVSHFRVNSIAPFGLGTPSRRWTLRFAPTEQRGTAEVGRLAAI